ncbi:hypothetical protein B0H14DRAFT_2559518 [Mycena olivaceomarginata]|nr:hypothetical protein B0H14DRAFT_2559518 [Mycena olivaceomarginata]
MFAFLRRPQSFPINSKQGIPFELVARCFCFSSTPQFDALLVWGDRKKQNRYKSTFKSIDGICGQAGTWENEGNRTEGCKDRAVIWRTSSEQYYDRKHPANGIQMVVDDELTVQVMVQVDRRHTGARANPVLSKVMSESTAQLKNQSFEGLQFARKWPQIAQGFVPKMVGFIRSLDRFGKSLEWRGSRGFEDKQFPFWEGGGGGLLGRRKKNYVWNLVFRFEGRKCYEKARKAFPAFSQAPRLPNTQDSCAAGATSSAAGGPPPKSGTENPGSGSLPLSPMPATSIANEPGSDRILMLDEIVVERRARWDYKTNMNLGACREHSGRNIPLDIWDAEMFSQELQNGCGGGKRRRS